MPTSGQIANRKTRDPEDYQSNRQAIRPSATMPQLTEYTKEDILEQYLSWKPPVVVGSQSGASTGGGGAGSGQKRRKLAGCQTTCSISDEQQQHRAQLDVSRLSGQDHSDFGKENISSESSRSRSKSRRATSGEAGNKRSRSLSLFSACFTIPNISSMLSSSGTGGGRRGSSSGGRRSILSHLGIQTHPKQRPISSSQTAGNLQQFSNNNNHSDGGDLTPGSQRKHVSFEGNRNRNLTTGSASQPQTVGAAPRGQQSNVILRNYQAHISQMQPQQQPLPPPLLYEQQPQVTGKFVMQYTCFRSPRLTHNNWLTKKLNYLDPNSSLYKHTHKKPTKWRARSQS